MFVRDFDGPTVTVDVFDTRPTIGDMLFEFRAHVRRQFFLDVLEEQLLGVAAAKAAEVQGSF